MSNIIQHLDKILLEARRNPEKNPKISIKEFLSKYENEKDVYVTFKSLEKIGVNPTAKWGHMSPVGVYAYPLSFVKRVLEWLQDDPSYIMPFAFNKKYVYVIKQVDVPGLKFIEDGSMYDDADLERDVKNWVSISKINMTMPPIFRKVWTMLKDLVIHISTVFMFLLKNCLDI